MGRLITLTTDFGLGDVFVGVMKGVILGINPKASIVDLSHQVPPQDVHQAAYLLLTAYPYFPPDTIHLAVVDPGVGSERRAIAMHTERAYFVAPDNGVVSYVATKSSVEKVVSLTNPRYWLSPPSRTFHGRDIFAPVAAHLSRGVALEDLGEEIQDMVKLPFPQAGLGADGSIVGEILHIDRFGNLVTDIPGEMLTKRGQVTITLLGRTIHGLSSSYVAVGEGKLLAYIGSAELLEIAARGGSAAEALAAKVGDEVQVREVGDRGY